MSIQHPRSVWYYSLGKVMATLARVIYGYMVDEENQENITSAREQLREGSIIAYFNHIFYGDGPLVATFLLDNLGLYIRRLVGPESRMHFDFSRDPLNASIMRIGGLLGIELYPVVQHYDLKSYSREERKQLLQKFYKEMTDTLSQRGGMMFIAPEGTRSKDGRLQRAQRGIEDIARKTNAKYFPIALIPKDDSDEGYNFGKRFKLVTGRLFDSIDIVQDRNNLTYTDMMMLRLAELLPESMRGYYSQFKL